MIAAAENPACAASLYRRFFAFVFDWVLITFMFAMMFLVGVMALNLREDFLTVLLDGRLHVLFLSRLWLFLFVTYHIFFSYFGGQTPSKMLFKIKIISLGGGRLSIVQAVLRTFSYFFSFFLFLGFLLALVTRHHRALHDLISNSLVVESGPGNMVEEVVENVDGLDSSTVAIRRFL